MAKAPEAGQSSHSSCGWPPARTRPNVSLIPTDSSLTLDADTLSASGGAQAGGLLSADPEAAQAFDQLPGESWLAIGLGHLGTEIDQDAQDIEALTTFGNSGLPSASTGLSLGSLLQALLTPLHVLGAATPRARRQFASWMGSAGMFASGANLLELKAAVAISSNNPASSRAAVAELGAQMRKGGATISPATVAGTEAAISVAITGLPVKLDIADGRSSSGQAKLVIGIGEPSVDAALNPQSTLASDAPTAASASGLGEGIQPSLLLNFPTFVSLLEGIGLLEQPPVSQVLPYLRASTTLIGGGRQLGGEAARFRLVLGLQGESERSQRLRPYGVGRGDFDRAVEHQAAVAHAIEAVARQRRFPALPDRVAPDHRVAPAGRQHVVDHRLTIVATPPEAATAFSTSVIASYPYSAYGPASAPKVAR